MTRDRPDSTAPDDPEGSWVRDLRDLERRGALGGDRTRLHDLAARRRTGQSRAQGDEPGGTAADPGREDSSSVSPLVTTIRRAASVDDLTIVGSPVDRRYGRSVATRVHVGGNRYDLELRLFRRPDTDGFADAVAEQFQRWVDLADVEGVLPTLDGGSDPRPWSLTAPVESTAADQPAESPGKALRNAAALVETVANLHERGAVHAGIDPRHVIYPAESRRPHLDNVGLLDVYRRYADPAILLDPRYAPPEYFDDRYGVVDRTTDVYALGAVLYRLLTGEPPYDGDPAAVRESVLTDPFPRPSAAVAVPDAVDRVVRRATATDKFDRYESAASLRRDLRNLRAVVDD